MTKYLICTDLDRTLIPNGFATEAPLVRERFAHVVNQENVLLAYVSGRNLTLVKQGIAEYALPDPDTVIADVGASIYHANGQGWIADGDWHNEIAVNWQGKNWHALAGLLENQKEIKLQDEQVNQSCPHKLSYFTRPDVNAVSLKRAIEGILFQHGFESRAIWSLDEAKNLGLLDILPLRASKLHAMEFLLRHAGIPPENCLFCGDSGNDLEALTGPIPSVLVANASTETRRQATHYSKKLNNEDRLFLARYQSDVDNGNYAGGILQGIQHFFPALYSR